MADDNNITKAANHMIERYGDNALKEVDLRIAELREQQQIDACELWTNIRKALKSLIDQSNSAIKH